MCVWAVRQLGIICKATETPLYCAAESFKFARLYPLNQQDLPAAALKSSLDPATHWAYVWSFDTLRQPPALVLISSSSSRIPASVRFLQHSRVRPAGGWGCAV